MNINIKTLRFLVLANLLSLIFYPMVTLASLADDLQAEINQKQAQIQELEKQISNYQAVLKSSQSQESTLKKEITKMETQIKALEAQITLTQTKISQTNLKIEGLASDIQTQNIALEKQKNNLGQILRTIDEYDQEDPFSLVMKNQNFSDFLNQTQYISNLQNSVQAALVEIKKLKSDLENQKTEQENQKTELLSLKNQLNGKSLALDDQKGGKQDLLTTTKSQEKQYQAMLTDLQKKRDQIEKEIYQAEEKLRLQINPNSIPTARKGLFVWPAQSQTITQTYGCILTAFARKSYPACDEGGSGGFHNGVDIDAEIGDPIRAVMDGTISSVGNLGKYAYGKWITIKHENGLTTLYAHLSAQSVKAGQKIKTGEIIGYAGNTGYSTGSHLHFTVYATNTFSIEQKSYGPLPLGGSVNPMSYL